MFFYEVDEDITLKFLDNNNAESLFRLTDTSRDSLREWLAWVDNTTTVADSKEFIDSTLNNYGEKKGMTTGIFYKGSLAGVVGINNFSWRNRIATIGYWLGTNYQGLGIMTRATSGLIDYAFHTLEMNRVEIRAAYENKRSRAIPERLGFVKEGQIRQAEWLYDHYVDHVIYGMLASEWESRNR
ncbi:GNAT family N-acetyltransferase [Virgibacillus litoralis]|uniref:Ribosomal-protein-serine acetyltransferase n=1 Tax=Virgibacillus litoralis TaxID=578221 RepID=A0ABS4HER7_9BACI|nr:GNAT family protein [Virgibacillus litoralis]MBP1949422.1 ribosomal-protein-serine acetyltransferase [Virgibacillus litoralis]